MCVEILFGDQLTEIMIQRGDRGQSALALVLEMLRKNLHQLAVQLEADNGVTGRIGDLGAVQRVLLPIAHLLCFR